MEYIPFCDQSKQRPEQIITDDHFSSSVALSLRLQFPPTVRSPSLSSLSRMGIGRFAPVHRGCKLPLSQQSGAGCCFTARGAVGAPAMDGRNAPRRLRCTAMDGGAPSSCHPSTTGNAPRTWLCCPPEGRSEMGVGPLAPSRASSPEERLGDWGQGRLCPSPRGEHRLARRHLRRWSGSGNLAPREAHPDGGTPLRPTSGGRVAPSPSHGLDLVVGWLINLHPKPLLPVVYKRTALHSELTNSSSTQTD
jgi:hypothetical protein